MVARTVFYLVLLTACVRLRFSYAYICDRAILGVLRLSQKTSLISHVHRGGDGSNNGTCLKGKTNKMRISKRKQIIMMAEPKVVVVKTFVLSAQKQAIRAFFLSAPQCRSVDIVILSKAD